MGTMTLADFRSDLRLVCGGIPANSNVWTDAVLTRRINHSYLWCSEPSHYRHPELEVVEQITLLANTARYLPLNTYYMIYGVAHARAAAGAVGDATQRVKLDPGDVREQLTATRTASLPAKYAYWNQRLYLNCLPNTTATGQVLEVYGYRQPPPLALATDVTLLKPEWDEIILTGAEWRIWVTMNEHDRAYEAKENLGALVNEVTDVRRALAEDWGWNTGSNPTSPMGSA